MIQRKQLPKDGNKFWQVTIEPVVEPITVGEFKEFARVDGTEEDNLLAGFIQAARINCEHYLGRALIEQTITLKMDFWPGNIIELPRPPLISITAVETLDESDTATIYSSDNYYINSTSIPGQLIIKENVTWPFNSDRDYSGYQIRYKAGYGTSISNVPKPIKESIKLWAANIYENRVVRAEPPPEVAPTLNLFRVIRL